MPDLNEVSSVSASPAKSRPLHSPRTREAARITKRFGVLGEVGVAAAERMRASGLVSETSCASWSACSAIERSIACLASARCSKARTGPDAASSVCDWARVAARFFCRVAISAWSAATSARAEFLRAPGLGIDLRGDRRELCFRAAQIRIIRAIDILQRADLGREISLFLAQLRQVRRDRGCVARGGLEPGLIRRQTRLRLRQRGGEPAGRLGRQAGLCALYHAGRGARLCKLRLGFVQLRLQLGLMRLQPGLRIAEAAKGVLALMREIKPHREIRRGGGERGIFGGEGHGEQVRTRHHRHTQRPSRRLGQRIGVMPGRAAQQIERPGGRLEDGAESRLRREIELRRQRPGHRQARNHRRLAGGHRILILHGRQGSAIRHGGLLRRVKQNARRRVGERQMGQDEGSQAEDREHAAKDEAPATAQAEELLREI